MARFNIGAWARKHRKKVKTVRTMAKRRRSYFGRARKFARKHQTGLTMGTALITGAAYGFGRPYAENLIKNNVPSFAGGYEDELLIGGLAGLLAWKGPRMLKAPALMIVGMETARIVSKSGGATGVNTATMGQMGPL